MIRCTRVSMQYPGRQQALKQVSLHVAHGEMAFVTGHSGAGKSTLLRLVALIERQSRGQIIINGQNLERIKGARIQLFRRQIGSIFQDYRLLHDRTVFDNVALPLAIVGYSPQEIGRRVRAALDKVALLHKARAYPITLSGGEQQRVGIARAVVNRPPLLLADEPTGNLDPDLSWDIMKLFTQFNQVGLTVLIATHDLSLIRRMNYRIITLREGRLVTDNREVVH